MNTDRKQMFRERILGNGAPVAPAYKQERWVELHSVAKRVAMPEKKCVAPLLEEVPPGTRYYNEDFVRGKIENWAGRPAGGQRHMLVVLESQGARLDALRDTSRIPTNHTDADVTNRALTALGDEVAFVLVYFHTENGNLQKIANVARISIGECHARLTQGHVDFTSHWKDQWLMLEAELRRRAPAVDPSANAVPVVPLPRDRPEVRPCVITREAAPVLDYRKTQDAV